MKQTICEKRLKLLNENDKQLERLVELTTRRYLNRNRAISSGFYD